MVVFSVKIRIHQRNPRFFVRDEIHFNLKFFSSFFPSSSISSTKKSLQVVHLQGFVCYLLVARTGIEPVLQE